MNQAPTSESIPYNSINVGLMNQIPTMQIALTE